jgi:alpha-methylacyl-CoA racemase
MGPLAGYRIVEFAGIGPAPMAAMLLADMGATVLRLDRPERAADLGIEKPARFNLLNRGRETVKLDLKSPAGLKTALDLIGKADALIEGFRPGTMERIGLGPEVCLARNPRLVYGRMTGWGQDGPLAPTAGHDLNYIALTGALHAIGRQGAAPTPPLNLVGDFGGGSLYLAFGLVCALLEAGRSGQGQVVDAAMVDGAASLMTSFYGLHAAGLHSDVRGENILDSGAPFYDCYECADGKFLAVAPIEKRFRAVMLERIGLDPASLPDDPASWPAARERLVAHFRSRSRDTWMALLEGSDACVAPVLSLTEAPNHPHLRARGTFVEIDGVVQPAPAPRFSRTRPETPKPPQVVQRSQVAILADWGLDTGN